MNEPKYDEDGVNLRYLRRILGGIEDTKELLDKLRRALRTVYNPNDDSVLQTGGNFKVYGIAKELMQYHGIAPTDLDEADTYGIYRLGDTHTHAPLTSGNYGILLVYESRGTKRDSSSGTSWIVQLALIRGIIYQRYAYNQAFTQWEEISNKYKPAILYENTSGSTANVTLSETIANYSEIEIMYSVASYHKSVRIPIRATSLNVILDGSYVGSQNMVIGSQVCVLSGTTLTRGNSAGKNINLSTNAITNNANLNFYIYKVVGYK
jgi:hypothetical protein